MNDQTTTSRSVSVSRPNALTLLASRLNVDPKVLMDSMKETVFKGATNAELLSLVVVAYEYRLNPMLRELYAFPKKGGGIVPVVGIDGWARIVNRQDDFDGVDFSWQEGDNGKPICCTCTMHVKGRSRPIVVAEFYAECHRNTDPWNNMPHRMLRHKAFMQAGRLAFGVSGIHDEDEGRDIAALGALPQGEMPKPDGASQTISRREQPAETGDEEYGPVRGQAEGTDGTEKTKKQAVRTPQEELAELVLNNGYNFDALIAFGIQSGNIPDDDQYTTFDDLPKDVCKRLLRSPVGLLDGMKRAIGEKEAK
jgi:phage recombination protein Bet